MFVIANKLLWRLVIMKQLIVFALILTAIPSFVSGQNIVAELRTLAEQRVKKQISETEYEKKKAEIIKSQLKTSPKTPESRKNTSVNKSVTSGPEASSKQSKLGGSGKAASKTMTTDSTTPVNWLEHLKLGLPLTNLREIFGEPTYKTPTYWEYKNFYVNCDDSTVIGYGSVAGSEQTQAITKVSKVAKVTGSQSTQKSTSDYKNKYPLHHAIKNSDIQTVKQLLAKPNLVINQFDAEGNTPWDVALDYKQPESLTELITTFGKIISPLTINVQVGINYQIGGFQATVNETLALQKKIKERNPTALKYLTELGETIYSTKNIVGHIQRSQAATWAEATNKMVTLALQSQPVLQFTKTDVTGKAVFQNIPPGEYIVVGLASTRSGLAAWFVEIEVTTTSPNLFFDEKNAIILF